MNVLILLIFLTKTALTAHTAEEALVDVTYNDQGHYNFTLTSKNITRIQEGFPDGTAKGMYSYLVDKRRRQNVLYSTISKELVVEGTVPPGSDAIESQDLNEVAETLAQFSIISENARRYLPKSKDVQVGEIGSNKEEFLNVVSERLNPDLRPVYIKKD